MKNYYIVLGITKSADANKIKRAYRKVAKKYHPDTGKAESNANHFREVKEAYETLSDENRRKAYDAELAKDGSKLRLSRRKVPDIISKKRVHGDRLDRFLTPVDDFFEGYVPGFFPRDRYISKDLYVEIVLSPHEALEGGLYPLTVPVIEPCPTCSRSGFWDDFFCPGCYGKGRIRSEREFSLSIPPRVPNGTQIKLSLEDIGLRNTILNITVIVDRNLEDNFW